MSVDPWGSPSRSVPGGRSPLRQAATHQVTSAASVITGSLDGKKRRLLLAGGGAAVAGLVLTTLLSGGPSPSEATPVVEQIAPVTSETTAPSPAPPPGKRAFYYMSFNELDGLPRDTPPWTPVELWVAWDPPITDEPLVQLLDDDVFIESILPPVVPGAGHVVKLSVRLKDRENLVYADRYGSLSVIFR